MVLDTPNKMTRAQVNRRVWRDFLDSYQSHVLMDEFKAGRSLNDIAKERGVRTTKVLEEYFNDRYGEGWRKVTESKPIDAESENKNRSISGLLAAGSTQREIAGKLGLTHQAVSERVRIYNLAGAD